MPLYEFYCPQCRKKFEELCRAALDSVPCPQCAAESKKVLSAFCTGGRGSGEGLASAGGCGG